MSDGELVDPTPGFFTPFLKLDEVLSDHAHSLHTVLGDNFVGLYLLGSLAIGDFDLTSDVDFMLVTNDELTHNEVESVQSRHAELVTRDTRWVKHLEYSVFPMQKLLEKTSPYGIDGRRNTVEDRQLWYFPNGSATMERSDHDNTLVTRWTLRNKSRAVFGCEAETIAPEVTVDELRREIRSSLLGWEQLILSDPSPFDNRFHQVFLVLNNCRALQDLFEGRITSKLDGVHWARRHLDVQWHSLIDFCWQERRDTEIHVSQPADRDAFERTIAFMKYTTRLAEEYRLTSE